MNIALSLHIEMFVFITRRICDACTGKIGNMCHGSVSITLVYCIIINQSMVDGRCYTSMFLLAMLCLNAFEFWPHFN